MSSALVWELVKNNNAFLKKGLNGAVFSSEPGNLTSQHSYKYSGLANFGKTVDVAASESGLVVSTSSKKKQGNLVSYPVKGTGRRVLRAAHAQAKSTRPDLANAARAKASALALSLRVKAAQTKVSA